MTNREAYIFGWVFGKLQSKKPESRRSDITLAAMRPYSASGKAINDAHRGGILKGALETEIMLALAQIDSVEPPMEGGSEKAQPLEMQGSWQLGYYKGLSGAPLPEEDFDLKGKRQAKNMTQAQLAEAINTDQAMISRWEKGTVKPSAESLRKLKEILD